MTINRKVRFKITVHVLVWSCLCMFVWVKRGVGSSDVGWWFNLVPNMSESFPFFSLIFTRFSSGKNIVSFHWNIDPVSVSFFFRSKSLRLMYTFHLIIPHELLTLLATEPYFIDSFIILFIIYSCETLGIFYFVFLFVFLLFSIFWQYLQCCRSSLGPQVGREPIDHFVIAINRCDHYRLHCLIRKS